MDPENYAHNFFHHLHDLYRAFSSIQGYPHLKSLIKNLKNVNNEGKVDVNIQAFHLSQIRYKYSSFSFISNFDTILSIFEKAMRNNLKFINM